MEYELAELFDLQMGKTPARHEPKYWENGNNRWMSIADLSTIDKFIDNTKECISDLALQDTKIYRIPENTVVMSFKLSIGKVAITRCPMYSNEAIVSFLPKKGVNVLANYLYYVLKAKRWDDAGNKAVKGVTLNKSSLSRAKIRLHSLEEQKHICNVLDKLSAAVWSRRTQLSKLDELVKARFVEMFQATEKSLSVGEICNLVNGRAFKPSDWSLSGIRIVRIQNLNNSDSDYNYYDGECDERYLIDNDDLLFSWSGTPGTSFGAFIWHGGKAVLNQHIFKVIPKVEVDLVFLKWALDYSLPKIIERAHGGVGLRHITKNELNDILLLYPGVREQKSFADFVQQVDKSKVVVRLSRKKIDDLRVMW